MLSMLYIRDTQQQLQQQQQWQQGQLSPRAHGKRNKKFELSTGFSAGL